MFISRNWLKDFVKIPDSLSAKELALKLTMSVAEVENFIDQKTMFDGVVVGEILEVKKHPNADKLQLAIVDIGKEKLNIVCGAPNIAVGQKVPVATIGTKLPNGMEIQKAKVRGEESAGMLCAEDELGLGKDHAGIMVLDLPAGRQDKKLKVGTAFSKALGLDDVIYEIDNKSLSNRPDLWSHYGLAREVAALVGDKLKEYKMVALREPQGDNRLDITIEDYKLCPRYMGIVLEGIKIAESPDWLKKRITAIGMRPINNIVDITNYVMMEIGQPLHAFDYDKLEGQRIVVRLAKPGEKIKTLDDQERKLEESMLVIADATKPVAIAGVMGGANTEIDRGTKKIIIESANFDHVSIRQTETKLGLRTEAAIRFEKSLDPNLAELGIKKAVELIMSLCSEAKIVSQLEDARKFKLNQGPLKVDLEFIEKRLGQEIDSKKIVSILESLGFAVKKAKDSLSILIPTWRATKDIAITEDIVEEVARIYGYANLIPQMPEVAMEQPIVNSERDLERKIKNLLAYGYAMSEVYNYSFVSEDLVRKTGVNLDDYKFVRVLNPLTVDCQLLRRDLLANALVNLNLNERFYEDIRIFEIGTTFLPELNGERVSDKSESYLPLQQKHLLGLVSEKGNEQPFYTAKNIAEGFLKHLRYDYKIEKAQMVPEWANSKRSLKVLINNQLVGLITEVNAKVLKNFDLKQKVGVFNFNLADLVRVYSPELKYKSIPKYPSIELDVSMILAKNILWAEVANLVTGVEKDLIKQIRIFDVYEGKNIPEGQKSIAFHIEYRCDDKTLTMDEVQIIHQKVLNLLESKLLAQIRK